MSGSRWRRYVRPLGKGNEGTRRFYTRVLKSCRSGGATYDVLVALVDNADFHQNTVTMTKAQMGAQSRKSRNSVDHALKHLKETGLIHPVAYGSGGRSCPTTYALVPAGDGIKPEVNMAESWGQDHPVWEAIRAALIEASKSRWDGVYSVLKFHSVDDGLLILVAPNAWVADKVERAHRDHLIDAAQGCGATDVHVIW